MITYRPFNHLDQLFIAQQDKIEAWFKQQWLLTPPPISSSVDLRNAGFKLAPVDTNLFPAGFNNLSTKFLPQSIQAARKLIIGLLPTCKNILIIAENHTRNQFYYESLAVLKNILTAAEYGVRIGSLVLTKRITINLAQQHKLIIEPVIRHGDYLEVKDFLPCLIFLNNDLSAGQPEILKNLRQPIKPPPELGWHLRLKSQHFYHYHQVCQEFAQLFPCDPWWFDPLFTVVDNIDFMLNQGMEILVAKTAALLSKIQQKYQEYNIPEKPFVMVKADAGTYGMAVITIHDVAQLLQLNRKDRKRMSHIKGDRVVTQVIVQEGIYSLETCGSEKIVAEPVIYMLNQYIIGGFYRVHAQKNWDENLNMPGMQFDSVPLAESCLNNYHNLDHQQHSINCFYTYGVVARLALLAAAREVYFYGHTKNSGFL